jgi:long-subunit fatty acid transport protein
MPALAVKIIDGLSVVGGVDIFATADGSANANIGPPLETTFQFKLKPELGGLLGVYFAPVDWLSFGICYRTERSFKLKFSEVVSALGITNPVNIQSIDFFTPHQVEFGAAIDLPHGMILCFDFTYFNYSAFREPFIVTTSTIPTPPRVHSNFHDTVVPRIGFEFTPLDWLALRAGYYYRMSPVGSQANQTFNLVDSDEHVLTMGVGFEYQRHAPPPAADKSPPPPTPGDANAFGESAVGLDLFFQAHILSGTSVKKSDPNDPIGGYNAGGAIFNMGFGIYGRF